MGRVYTVPYSFTYANAAGDHDVIYLAPADDQPIKLRGFKVSQTSEVGDAAEENLRFSILRLLATVTPSSGGAAIVPSRVDTADGTATFTARAGDTVIATATGGTTTMEELGWNERSTPYETWWPVEFSFKAKGGEALVIRGQTTAADDMVMQVTAYVEEE